MIHNRRKRAEYFAEQHALLQNAIQNAEVAVASGTASEEDIEFLNRERAHQAEVEKAQLEKANKKGVLKRGKEWLFSGLKKEEEGDDVGSTERRLGYEGLSEEDDTFGERESDILRAIEEKKIAMQEKAKAAFAKEREAQRIGGPLDRIGTAPDGAGEEQKSRGWFSFLTGR